MTTKNNCAYGSTVLAIIISVAILTNGCSFNRMSAEATQITEVDTKMTKEERFAEVFQKAIDVAERRLANYDPEKDPLRRSDLQDIIKILRNQKQVVLTQGVEVYDGAYGPGYHVIDLGEPVNSDLRNAVYEIEIFYKENYIALMTKEERFARIIERAIELAKGDLEGYDADTTRLTKEQLAGLIRMLTERRKKVLTEGVKPYERGQYEFVRELDDSGEPEDSALRYVVHEIEVFHRENF